MKKLVVGIVFSVSIYFITTSAFALRAMTDSTMKKTTGQTGVQIEIDNVDIEDSGWELYYVDDDGIGGVASDSGTIKTEAEIGIKKILAVQDGTDRSYEADGTERDAGLHLQREYGSILQRENNEIESAYSDWQALDPVVNILSIDDWKEKNPEDVAAAIKTSGGDIEISPISIDVTGKLDFHSNISAFSRREEGLVIAEAAYNDLSNLLLTYSYDGSGNEDTKNENIDTIITETGMSENEAVRIYNAANSYASILAAPDNETLRNRVGRDIVYDGIYISGITAKLPTLEIFTNNSSEIISISSVEDTKDFVEDGQVDYVRPYNYGKEYLRISKTNSTLTILGGTIEVCAY